METDQTFTAPTAQQIPPQAKYCLYARKSTEGDERQALSIDSQVKEMLQIAERDGLEVVEVRRGTFGQGIRPAASVSRADRRH